MLALDTTKKKYIAAGLVGVLLLGGVAYGVTSRVNTSPQEEVQTQVQLIPTTIQITSPEFTDTSTPVIAHITSSDRRIDYYHAVSAGTDDAKRESQMVELPAGEYALEFISSVTEGGGIVEIKGTSATITDKDSHAQVKPETSYIRPEDVTAEMYQEIADKTKAAIESGSVDDTLTGKAAETITKQLAGNISSNETISKEDTQEAAKTTEAIKAVETPKEKAKTPATVVVTPVQGNTSAKPATPQKPTEQKKPAESKQTPEKKKEKVWVVDKPSRTEKKLVKEAWTETVVVEPGHYKEIWEERVIDIKSGKRFTSVEAWGDYNFDLMDKGEPGGNYTVKEVVVDKKWIPEKTKTIKHDAQYEEVFYPEEGHYEWK